MEHGKQWVLVTGGLGYIGSHVAVELCLTGFNVIVVDRLLSSKIATSKKMKQILELEDCNSQIHFAYKDLQKEDLWIPRKCDYIIHLAAFKSVGESVADPLKYYRNNINSLLCVLRCAEDWGNKPVFIFSSSATVYAPTTNLPLTEESALGPVNPYGHTKLMCEQIIRDTVNAPQSPISSAMLLRYFNPVGAHPTGLIGEDAVKDAANLMPVLCQTLLGEREALHIFGTDYDTQDGTAVRDYLHIMDLVRAHINACQCEVKPNEVEVINLGRGMGVSVQQMVTCMENVTGQKIPVVLAPRRSGDAPACYTSCERALSRLDWVATRGLKEMCKSAAGARGIKTATS